MLILVFDRRRVANVRKLTSVEGTERFEVCSDFFEITQRNVFSSTM